MIFYKKKHSLVVIDPCAKYGMPIYMSKQTEIRVGYEHTTKTYKFDLEVKGQRHIGIMNVRNTSSRGDRCMCQIWY